MRRILFFVLLLVSLDGFSQENVQVNKWTFSGSFSINSNGINPIPAFSLGKAAAIANLSISKGWFNYEPGLAYAFDAKPWYVDNWFHIYLVRKPVFKLRTGVNFSMFFMEKTVSGEKFLNGDRYLTGEIAGIFTLPGNTNIWLMYWNDNGQERGTINGHYFNLFIEKTDINAGDEFRLAASLQIFMLQYTANNDGFFISPKLTFTRNKFPLALYTQANIPVTTNMLPAPKFQWNIGLAYIF